MTSRFRLQITDGEGRVVMAPGGVLEVDLREALVKALVRAAVSEAVGGPAAQQRLLVLAKEAILAQGVGYFKSEAKVAAAVEQGLRTAMRSIAEDLTGLSAPAVEAAITAVFQGLKQRVAGVV